MNVCKSYPESLSSSKASEDIPSGFSVATVSSFKRIKNKHDVFRSKGYRKIFFKSLREHAMKIIN